jgi:hypothetical protein
MTSLTSFLGRPVTLPERHPDGSLRVRVGDRWSDPIPPGTTQAEIERMRLLMERGLSPTWAQVRANLARGAA